jgi:hypothetical protein
MKFVRLLSQIVVLLVASAVFIGLTSIYHSSLYSVLPEATIESIGPGAFARYQYEKRHQPSAARIGYFSDFAAYGMLLTIFTLTGRILFRIRLNSPPRSEGKPILLDLRQRRQEN